MTFVADNTNLLILIWSYYWIAECSGTYKMKLRIRENSLRLRLTKSEVAKIGEGGAVQETVEFGGEPAQRLIYAIEVKNNLENSTAVFDAGSITVFIPKAQAVKWAQTNQIGIEAEKSIDGEKTLRILIEKDFSCLEPRAGEEDADTFAHPFQNGSGKSDTLNSF
ncbi:MAG: hypothetical protein JWN60_2276 [Acidobacteria bacterium]|nr:hypothetical protein [Acidobacteriota bacterium]